MSKNADVIVVGAGAAGLAAAAELGRSGLSVTILEARDRIGGRMFTQTDPVGNASIEFGAEFIHGRPHEIWKPLQERNVRIEELDGDAWCVRNKRLVSCDFFSQVNEILEEMDDNSPDESFVSFLEHCCQSKKGGRLTEAKARALDYITGFNAADPSLVGVHWLVKGMRAEEKIEGDRAFRPEIGYEALVGIFREQLAEAHVSARTDCVVEEITWKPGHAELTVRDGGRREQFVSARVLVTLPLGVLKADAGKTGAVRFDPPLPASKLAALEKVEMGKVIKIVLRFSERFWEKIQPSDDSSKTLAEMSFLFSHDEWFPTWWTTLPEKLPIITGWAPFRCAEKLSGRSHDYVVERSLQTLEGLLHVKRQKLENLLEAAYFHDWQSDPFSRGAYSYGKVGSDGAYEALASPLQDTLFFAGEATYTSGHNGTVHGAIASGQRAAREILDSVRDSISGIASKF
jgi:monoamine oxidase